jgi:glycosyltransferase involved in cell wall biosynthesis
MNAKSLTFVVACRALRQIPVVHAVRGWATPDQLGAWLRFLFRRRVAAVMAVSTAAAAQLRTAGVDPKRLHTISSTIDFQAIQRQSQEPLAAPVGGTEGCPKLLMLAARPEPAKGHATALRAMARLIQEGRSPVLWIPGEPPVGVGGGYPRELKRRCEELKISDCVHFLGWRADMPQLIRASDICLLPSHTEGLPRSVLEAMLLRRPVVATGVGGIPDAITDGVTGHLFEVDDDQALSRCIAKLTDDDVHRNAIVKAASAHLKAKFDPDEHTRRVEAVFASVVGSAT